MKKNKPYQPDTLMKDFWRNQSRFTDLCNGLLFQGDHVISDVRELDSEQSTTLQKQSIQRRRDLLKITDIDGDKVIIGIENQQRKDRTMPLRDLEYTSLKYSIRLKDKSNKTYPVITIILYYGKAKWKSQNELRMMMKVPKKLEKYFNNWSSYIVDAKEVDSQLFKNKEVKDFFEGLQNLHNWDKDIRHLKNIHLTYDTALALGVVMKIQPLIDKAEKEQGGMINMCQAVDEALKESRLSGIKSGIKKGIRTGKQENVDKLIHKKFKKRARWLDRCTIKQLDRALDLILEELSYAQFKKEVLK